MKQHPFLTGLSSHAVRHREDCHHEDRHEDRHNDGDELCLEEPENNNSHPCDQGSGTLIGAQPPLGQGSGSGTSDHGSGISGSGMLAI